MRGGIGLLNITSMSITCWINAVNCELSREIVCVMVGEGIPVLSTFQSWGPGVDALGPGQRTPQCITVQTYQQFNSSYRNSLSKYGSPTHVDDISVFLHGDTLR
eukprot:TRINITY_DN34910_c0_g1_i1.p2 TRINITY_DN34910_c0_g1~~TRINITY_DN34910_c0_g1_i1.p2  ORF type:complete len:104 (+),score=1.78 TRINITY_DN34910_c0_g1_i1:128-439(+)